MQKKLFLLLVFITAALVTSSWNYKGNELADNQILVFITGSDVSQAPPAAEIEAAPKEIKPTEVVQVKIDGVTTGCKVTPFATNTRAVGYVNEGSLQNGVSFSPENEYLQWWTNARGRFATTELINSLEIAACAVKYTTGVKTRVNALSLQNGGPYTPHVTHQNGLDADVAFTCKRGVEYYNCNNADGNFDDAANWLFIRTLAEFTPVKQIYLDQALINRLQRFATANDPGNPLISKIFTDQNALLRHVKNHHNHFHIYLHCNEGDTGCLEYPGGFHGRGAEGPIFEGETGEEAEPPVVATGAPRSDAELLAIADSRTDECLYFTDNELNPLVSQCSQRYGINENLLKAIIFHESVGNSCENNGGKPRVVSTLSAKGLMQLKDDGLADVNRFRSTATPDRPTATSEIFNPSQNICAGAQLLAIYWAQYRSGLGLSSTSELLQAYNVGYGNYRRGQRNANYVRLVKNAYTLISSENDLPATPERSGSTVNHLGNPTAPVPLVS